MYNRIKKKVSTKVCISFKTHRESTGSRDVLRNSSKSSIQTLLQQEHSLFPINWKNLNEVADEFRRKIYDWYFEPAQELAKNGHFAFSVIAINCIMIDTLSQFIYGTLKYDPKIFKRFIKARLPNYYSDPLIKPIQHEDLSKARN